MLTHDERLSRPVQYNRLAGPRAIQEKSLEMNGSSKCEMRAITVGTSDSLTLRVVADAVNERGRGGMNFSDVLRALG